MTIERVVSGPTGSQRERRVNIERAASGRSESQRERRVNIEVIGLSHTKSQWELHVNIERAGTETCGNASNRTASVSYGVAAETAREHRAGMVLDLRNHNRSGPCRTSNVSDRVVWNHNWSGA